MSWHYSGIGKPQAVYMDARKHLEYQIKTMAEPEQELAQRFLSTLSTVACTMPKQSVIKVTASGSQYALAHADTIEHQGIYTNFKIEIEPVYGFCEHIEPLAGSVE